MVCRSILFAASAAVLATASTAAATNNVVYDESEVMQNPSTYKYKIPGAVMTFAAEDTYTPYHVHDMSTLKGVHGEYYIVNGVRFGDGDVVEIPAGTAYDSMFPEGSTIACNCGIYLSAKKLAEGDEPANINRIESVEVDPSRIIQFGQWSPLSNNEYHKTVEEWNAMNQTARIAFKAEYYQHSTPFHKPASLL